jgi:pimeloyl-ACP methyl ester carboxylesterase
VGSLAAAAAVGAALAAGACYRASSELLAPHLVVRAGALDPGSEGLAFRAVSIRGPLGPAPAWLVPGAGRGWAIVVHGMGAPRAEGLPILPELHRAGLTTLVISYRNDPGAPRSPDGLTHLGADEWRDLDAAAGYAERHGARRLTLVGYSMGGAMVCDFLRRSPRAALVDRAVLDSPVLEWRGPLRAAADRASVPSALLGPAERMVEWRAGIDLSDEDQLAHAGHLRAPILVLHGAADKVVPIADSRALVRRLPGQVRLVEFPGAAHAASWDADPRRYEAAVREFLAGG